MKLRPYQQDAVDAAVAWMRRRVDPAVMGLATGAGKSHIIAGVAHWVQDTNGKKVLCLQPSAELTEQNHAKYVLTGERAGIYSASCGRKELGHPVTYGTPGTIKGGLSRFCAGNFGAVIVDEAHTTTPTIREIIQAMRSANPRLRVLGLSATPYRMLDGYIYQYDEEGRWVDAAREPYYAHLIYRIGTRELIAMGFLSPAYADDVPALQYEAAGLQLNSRGQFDARAVEQVFEGHGRKTAQIVQDVVQRSAGKRGVLLYASTVAHAKEILASLPPGARMIGGDENMARVERARLIEDFKAQRFKYLVNVQVLTTGFDAPHADVIAVLRATESPGLFQQIIGRGLRVADGKAYCLVLDYAQNIERHELHDDLFEPKIGVPKIKTDVDLIHAWCPVCNRENEFTARPNLDGFHVERAGYFVDAAGERIQGEHGEIPAHFGRRCTGEVRTDTPGVVARCGYRWNGKDCGECGADNDIAARRCHACRAELVDPNEALRLEFARAKRDPYQVSTDEVRAWSASASLSEAGNETLRCEYTTDYRTFTVWYLPKMPAPWRELCAAVYKGHLAPDVQTFIQYLPNAKPPGTVTYCKDRASGFMRVFAHNRPADKLPQEAA